MNLSVVPRALGYLEMADTVTVDGQPVIGAWTTTINLRVPLDGLDGGRERRDRPLLRAERADQPGRVQRATRATKPAS